MPSNTKDYIIHYEGIVYEVVSSKDRAIQAILKLAKDKGIYIETKEKPRWFRLYSEHLKDTFKDQEFTFKEALNVLSPLLKHTTLSAVFKELRKLNELITTLDKENSRIRIYKFSSAYPSA